MHHSYLLPTNLDNDCVGGQVDPPGQSSRADQHFDQPFGEQPLHEVAVLTQHSSVVDAEPVQEQVSELLVARL